MTGGPNGPLLDRAALDGMPAASGRQCNLEVVQESHLKRTIFLPTQSGAISLWQRPETGHLYIIGVRWSPDWPVAVVFDQKTGEQVALLRYPSTPAEFSDRVAALGRIYNWAFLVPEVNDIGFRDALLCTRYPLERIFSRRRDPHGVGSGRPEDMGFETSGHTRPRLITALRDAVRDRTITLCGSLMIEQCRTFVVRPDGTIGGADASDDYLVWAAALAAIGLEFAPKPEPYVQRMKGSFVDPRASRWK
jgi:hypothetical protein